MFAMKCSHDTRLCNPRMAGLALIVAVWAPNTDARAVDTTSISDHTWEVGVASERNRAVDDNGEALNKLGVAISYGLTTYWSTDIGGELSQDSEGLRRYTATSLTNKFALPAIGDAWPSLGVVVGYSFPSAVTDASILEVKLIADKSVGAWTHAINLGSEQSIARVFGNEAQLTLGYTTRWAASLLFSPAIEIYQESSFGADGDGDEGLQLGPAFSGSYTFGKRGSVNYEAGYLQGVTHSIPTTVKAKISYSMGF